MNFFKKIYCRTSQTIFKAAIPFLPYRNPIRLHSIRDIPQLLKQKELSRVLIITDTPLRNLGLTLPLENALKDSDIKYIIYDGTVPNPTIQNVEQARRLYLQNNCKGIIALGGGSVIDCAKITAARIVLPKKTVKKMKGVFRILHRLPWLIAIPTTAGTGSETTASALITDEKNRHKFTINDLSLIPHAAVLDPRLTENLPPHITSTTGIDALTHAVEAYIGRSTVRSTRADALTAVKLVFENIETVYTDGHNLPARAKMLEASFLAGRAFAKSYVGYCHAVAHSLGGKYNTPHGLANAVLLPYVLESYGNVIHKKLKKLAIAAGIADNDTPAKQAAECFIREIRRLNSTMSIPETIEGIHTLDISALAAKAEKEANPFYPVPKLMTKKDLEQFYYDVMEKNTICSEKKLPPLSPHKKNTSIPASRYPSNIASTS